MDHPRMGKSFSIFNSTTPFLLKQWPKLLFILRNELLANIPGYTVQTALLVGIQ